MRKRNPVRHPGRHFLEKFKLHLLRFHDLNRNIIFPDRNCENIIGSDFAVVVLAVINVIEVARINIRAGVGFLVK